MTDFMEDIVELNRIIIRMKDRNDKRIRELEQRIEEMDKVLHREGEKNDDSGT
jgi:hypothetical protein